MKHLSLLAAGLVAAGSLVAVAARAQDATVFVPAQTDTQYLAKDHLIGAKVHGKDGTIIGDVEDLIINDQNTVVGVVMGTGGYLGFAEKKIGVDLASLKFDEKDGVMFVSLPDVTKEALDAAPAFARKKPPRSLFDTAKEKVHELSDKTKASAQSAIDKAKPALEQAKEKAIEAVDEAKKAAGPVIEQAKEAVSGAVDAAKQKIDEATKSSEPAPATATPTEPAPATPAEPAPAAPPANP
jgi:sporulation protein YlmC with PRC-barrel domain/ElaB/YqjD/DUF883 family membrane-anchored ribosome-binding protein